MVDTGILSNNMKFLSHECKMTFCSLTKYNDNPPPIRPVQIRCVTYIMTNPYKVIRRMKNVNTQIKLELFFFQIFGLLKFIKKRNTTKIMLHPSLPFTLDITFLSHLFPLPCGAGSTVPREGFDSSVIMPFPWCVVAVTLPI